MSVSHWRSDSHGCMSLTPKRLTRFSKSCRPHKYDVGSSITIHQTQLHLYTTLRGHQTSIWHFSTQGWALSSCSHFILLRGHLQTKLCLKNCEVKGEGSVRPWKLVDLSGSLSCLLCFGWAQAHQVCAHTCVCMQYIHTRTYYVRTYTHRYTHTHKH